MNKEYLQNLIGENIRNERTARDMTIDDVARVLKLTPGFVGLIERGKRGTTAHILYKLSQAFQISVDSLFTHNSDDLNEDSGKLGYDADNRRKNKAVSLVGGLSDDELEFIILVINGLRKMEEKRILGNSAIDENDNCDETGRQ